MTPPIALSALVADVYCDPEDGPLDEGDAFELAALIAEYLRDYPERAEQLPSAERTALDRLWYAEDAWFARGAGFNAVIEAQEAVGEIIRATFPPHT